MKYLYFARVPHENEAIVAENLLGFCSQHGIAAREIVIHEDGRYRAELSECLADALAIVSPNWHLDHSCIGDRLFLDVAAEANVPVIQWFFDHPSCRWPEFVYSNASNSRYLFQSGYSESYFRRFILPNSRSSWISTYGANWNSRVDGLDHESFLARDIRCLVPLNLRRVGGGIAEVSQRLDSLPIHIRKVIRDTIESAYPDLLNPIESHPLSVDLWNSLGDQALFHHCIQIIEETVQHRRRRRIFEVAQDFPVLLQSDIVSQYLRPAGKAALEEGVSTAETLRRMRRSRSVISVTHVNDQVHPRIPNALNAGAVNIVEDNLVHNKIFQNGKNALLFRYDDDSLRDALSLVCFEPGEAYRIADAGFAMRDEQSFKYGQFDRLVDLAGGDDGGAPTVEKHIESKAEEVRSTGKADAGQAVDLQGYFIGKDFTTDWASRNYPIWMSILGPLRHDPISILEIGSWEGRSALFFLNYLSQSEIVCVDTFEGSSEHRARPLDWQTSHLQPMEMRFDRNLAEFAGRVEKIKDESLTALGRLGLARRQFGLVYVDGSHRPIDVYRDALLAWPLLVRGGIMIFDDYVWTNAAPEDRPHIAIDIFLDMFDTRYVELARGDQLIIRKLEE